VRGRTARGDATRALDLARGALKDLVELVRRQEQELGQLRAESERFDEIRAIIDGTTPARGGQRRSETAQRAANQSAQSLARLGTLIAAVFAGT
jgi:hypothetical protein